MAIHIGDPVTVQPTERDPYILQFQRFATVVRITERGAFVSLANVTPRGEEFGPIPVCRLLPGWRDEFGRWRWAP